MRVVFIEPAGKGGMIHYAYQLCRALQSRGAEITLVTEGNYELAALPQPFAVDRSISLWDPKPEGRLSSAPWAVAFRKLRRIGRAARYYREWLRIIRRVTSLRPDVVLLGDIRFPFDLLPLMLLRRRVPFMADICHNVRPFVTSGGSAGLFARSRWREIFYRRIYRLFDVVFVHFERNRREFIDTFGIAGERVSVIVHGNEEIFRELRTPGVDPASLRTRISLPAEAPVVLFFGTLSRYKGVDTLLEAFPRVLERVPAARLVIVGYPTADFDLAAHQEQARSLAIEQAVTWIPEYVPSGDVAAWMELASVIVFPYREIYQSGALHVPQTFGVPIVASAIGAMQDVIENEVSGLLVERGNPGVLAEALTRILSDRSLAARLGSQAAADAQGRFSWRAIAGLILDALPRPSDHGG